MKIKLGFIILFLVPLYASTQWFQQNCTINSPLGSLYFYDNSLGCAAGFYENYLKTNDGGQNWVAITNNTEGYLWDVFILSPSSFWAVGISNASFYADGLILTNSGSGSWNQKFILPMAGFFDILFVDEAIGWAAGGHHDEAEDFGIIYKTEDGGDTWVQQIAFPGSYFYAADFKNESVGWVAGSSGTILHTANGGLNWDQQESGTDYFLSFIQFADLNNGWIGGYRITSFNDISIILHTTSGGDTWSTQFIDSTFLIKGLEFVNYHTGWLVGDDGLIMNTTDGGENWTQQPTFTTEQLSDVFFTDSLNGWVIGGSDEIYHTSNAGGLYTNVQDIEVKNDIHFTCFPNPFTTRTQLVYNLPMESNVQITIFNQFGDRVKVIDMPDKLIGIQQVALNGNELKAGVYFCTLKTNLPAGGQTKKIIKL